MNQIEQNPYINPDDENAPEITLEEAYIPLDVYNYNYLQRRVSNACAFFMRCSLPFGLIIIDIDHFKRFNDLHGSDKGDLLLNNFVSMVKSFMRRGDLLSSYGEDSYVLILRESEWGYCAQRAETIRKEFLERFHDEPAKLSISIGAVVYPYASRQVSELITEAHYALHLSKNRGGNCVTIFPTAPPAGPPGASFPAHVDPPRHPPALSSGYEQSFPEDL
ncbi:MAG: GGDEF domain-containing protein [Candidatus Eremiobacteraeota bacterium]|nr:GGDEF domain-containing protein [Candidatus Eremiobacteraeota bacterium]